MALLWIGLGFGAFGALIGSIAGLSSAELTTMLLGLLFAMIGGSLGVLLGKLDTEGRTFTGVALLAFSVFAIFGLYSGIYVRINNLLSVTVPSQTAKQGSRTETKTSSAYLHGLNVDLVDHLNREVSLGRMTVPQACALLDKKGKDANAE